MTHLDNAKDWLNEGETLLATAHALIDIAESLQDLASTLASGDPLSVQAWVHGVSPEGQ